MSTCFLDRKTMWCTAYLYPGLCCSWCSRRPRSHCPGSTRSNRDIFIFIIFFFFFTFQKGLFSIFMRWKIKFIFTEPTSLHHVLNSEVIKSVWEHYQVVKRERAGCGKNYEYNVGKKEMKQYHFLIIYRLLGKISSGEKKKEEENQDLKNWVGMNIKL